MKPESVPSPHRPAPTTGQRLAFVGAAALFVGWLCWLGYLGLTAQTPVVLSRPQFLVSALDVVVSLDQAPASPQQATVKQVLWSGIEEGRKLEGTAITITNLERCRDWTAPGDYLVPLIPDGPGRWQVPATPRSPGYEPNPNTASGRPQLYPATPQTLRQYATITKP